MRSTIVAFVAILPAALSAAPAPPLSWGKPGVSLATYRAESIGCAMRAYYTDVSGTKAAQSFAEGSRQIDSVINSGADVTDQASMIGHVVNAVRPAEGQKEVKQFQIAQLNKCLLDHGYRRFRLTDDQRKHLERLKIGSEARHAYLHRLASDPQIISAQAEPDPSPASQP
jgi:hypothetical protein